MIDTLIFDLKEHLRIKGHAEDTLLTLYAGAAMDYIRNYTGRDWSGVDVPSAVTAAVLLIVGDLYENREWQGPDAYHTNKTVDRLLDPYRDFGSEEEEE